MSDNSLCDVHNGVQRIDRDRYNTHIFLSGYFQKLGETSLGTRISRTKDPPPSSLAGTP